MKKIIALFLVLGLLMAGCGSATPSASTDPAETQQSTQQTDGNTIEAPQQETEAPDEPLASAGALGDYEIVIGECEFVTDYEGTPAILIHYTFTNNSDESRSAAFSVTLDAFQNGIGLEDAVITDESVHDNGMASKEIQPGITIELTEVYLLTSDTAPVEFYVSEYVSLDGFGLGKVFETTPGGTSEISVAPGADSAVTIGKYAVSLNSYSIDVDYKGNPALILNIGFTNNSNRAVPFYAALDIVAFQDGIELDTAYFLDDSVVDSTLSILDVMPGAGHGVQEAFVLLNETSPVDIEIRLSFSFTDEKITTQINIAE